MQPINPYKKQDNQSAGREELGQGATTGESLVSAPQSRSLSEDLILPGNDIEEQVRIPKAIESEEIMFGTSCLRSAHTTGFPAVCA